MTDPVLAFSKGSDLPLCTCDGRGWSIVIHGGKEVAQRCLRCKDQGFTRQCGGTPRTWATWVPRLELEEQVAAQRAWRGPEAWSCRLWGGPGSGKTHGMQATGHEWLARGFEVRYAVLPEYLERIRKSYGEDAPQVPELMTFDGLLILDELALGKTTEWVQETLERSVGFRYRSGLPTLFATNQHLNVLGVRFPRLTDRLFEGLLLNWEAPSWRRR